MKLPQSIYNIVSFIGAIISGISLFLIVLLFVSSIIIEQGSSYLGLFTYIILPVFLIIGLIIIPIGMLIQRKKATNKLAPLPIIDFNLKKYRNAFLIFSIGTTLLLFLSALGSYQAFHYTESVAFCGTLCHEVMEPEYVAYQNSPHARVSCVKCHVGNGANWYIKSKLSGLRQVYGVLSNDFNRPIETPITNLRPAQETCEQCHWPEKFYAHLLRKNKHFLTDSLNTEWNINLQMKIGPSHSSLGLSEGIHWHINPNVKIEYIAKRDDRKKIPWVKYSNLSTGEQIIYQDTIKPLKQKKIDETIPRTMDCMDCHNRPSHQFATPSSFIDNGMISGIIPSDLPYIKKIAMDLFVNPYDHKDSALLTIKQYVTNYYSTNYPEIYKNKKSKIDSAIQGISDGFSRNIFPSMGASWDSYTHNIGHKTYDGCFRCHTNNHVAENGRTISKDCNLCHDIIMQGAKNNEIYSTINKALVFKHPVDINNDWETSLCTECHRYLYN